MILVHKKINRSDKNIYIWITPEGKTIYTKRRTTRIQDDKARNEAYINIFSYWNIGVFPLHKAKKKDPDAISLFKFARRC